MLGKLLTNTPNSDQIDDDVLRPEEVAALKIIDEHIALLTAPIKISIVGTSYAEESITHEQYLALTDTDLESGANLHKALERFREEIFLQKKHGEQSPAEP